MLGVKMYMKRLICIFIMLIFVFICGCSSKESKEGSAQSEEPPKASAETAKPSEKTIGDKFKTDLGPLNGLTTKGQTIRNTTEQAIKVMNERAKKTLKPKPKAKLKSGTKT